MIGRLSGILLEKNPPQLLLDVQGVAYEVDVPMSTFYNLPGNGERVTLWTHAELTAARAIYAKLGFRKTGQESHDDWGGKATSEFWDLDL